MSEPRLADLRRTRAASTCNHYRQVLFSLYKNLDGRDAPNPVRDVAPFPTPAPEPRGLSVRHHPQHPRGHVGSGQRDRQGLPARRRIGGEGAVPRAGVYGRAAQRVDALPARAPEPGDADARRSHGEGRPDADDPAERASRFVVTFGYALVQVCDDPAALPDFATLIRSAFPSHSCVIVAADAYSLTARPAFRRQCAELETALNSVDVVLENRLIPIRRSIMSARLTME